MLRHWTIQIIPAGTAIALAYSCEIEKQTHGGERTDGQTDKGRKEIFSFSAVEL